MSDVTSSEYKSVATLLTVGFYLLSLWLTEPGFEGWDDGMANDDATVQSCAVLYTSIKVGEDNIAPYVETQTHFLCQKCVTWFYLEIKGVCLTLLTRPAPHCWSHIPATYWL